MKLSVGVTVLPPISAAQNGSLRFVWFSKGQRFFFQEPRDLVLRIQPQGDGGAEGSHDRIGCQVGEGHPITW